MGTKSILIEGPAIASAESDIVVRRPVNRDQPWECWLAGIACIRRSYYAVVV